MKLHEQVITLDQAKKLKEIGIVEDSLFYWLDNGGERTQAIIYNEDKKNIWGDIGFPAFTVSELMDMLPHELGDRMLTIMPSNEGNEFLYTVLYLPLGNSIIDYIEDDYIDAQTLAEALGNMLIKQSDKSL